MKMPFLSVLFLVGLLAISGCKPLTEQQANREVESSFRRTCANFHYVPEWFSGPIKANVGGAAFAFQWKATQQSGHNFGILVTIDADGGENVSLFGDIPDTFDPRKLSP